MHYHLCTYVCNWNLKNEFHILIVKMYNKSTLLLLYYCRAINILVCSISVNKSSQIYRFVVRKTSRSQGCCCQVYESDTRQGLLFHPREVEVLADRRRTGEGQDRNRLCWPLGIVARLCGGSLPRRAISPSTNKHTETYNLNSY